MKMAIWSKKNNGGTWSAANQEDGLQTICAPLNKVASRQTERDQEMEKGDRGAQRAWSVSGVINDSQSHSRDPDLCYIGGALGGITRHRDFPVEVKGLHLITGPPMRRVNETPSDESVAADWAHIGKAESARLGARCRAAVHHSRNTRFTTEKQHNRENSCEAANKMAFFCLEPYIKHCIFMGGSI